MKSVNLKRGLPILGYIVFCSLFFVNRGIVNEEAIKRSGEITYENLSVKFYLFKAMLPEQSIAVFNKDSFKQKIASSIITMSV